MTKQRRPTIIAQVEEDGVMVNIELPPLFLEFYKKETGHARVTKKGVTRFLNRLIETYEARFKACCS